MRGGGGNITLLEDSFDDLLVRFKDEKPQFDYIVFHGIFAWVNRAIQNTILQIIRHYLKPGGVVYNSYNCYPGWAPKAPWRHLFKLFSDNSSGESTEKVHAMFGFFETFLQSKPSYIQLTPASQKVLEAVKKHVDSHHEAYVAHEYFGDTWDCFWFSDVAARMRDVKCDYACSAEILGHYEALNIPPEAFGFLKSIKNKIFREQLKDFYANRQFRKDVYQKGYSKLTPFAISQKLLHTEFVLIKPLNEFKNTINTSRGEAELAKDIYNKVLDVLQQKAFAPKTMGEIQHSTEIPFPTLLTAMSILVAQGMCLPCQKYNTKIKKQADAYNKHLFETQMIGSSSAFVASPLTGSGVVAPETFQLMIKGYMENCKSLQDLSQYIWEIYKSRGRRIIIDGKELNEDSQNIAEIEKVAKDFLEHRLPIFKQLGIC